MTRRPWSLSAQLISLCLAAIAPLVILGAWNLHAAREASSEFARRYAIHLAQITASETARFLVQARNIVTGLARRAEVGALDPARCDPILKELLGLAPRFANALTLDIEGNLVCSGVPLAADFVFAVGGA